MLELGFTILLFITAYFTGSFVERRHYRRIIKAEKRFSYIPVISSQWKQHITDEDEGEYIGSNVVIGSDYFKTVVAGLRSIVGGRVSTYESLVDRGRRHALIRLKLNAEKIGAYKIINVRIETATISGASRQGGMPIVEMFAYGTAIKKVQ